MRVVLQTETQECGLACITMIADAHRLKFDLATLRRCFSVSLKGSTLLDLINYAQQLNFSCRAVKLDLNDLDKLVLPCILHWDLNHFVVLEKISKNKKFTIIDPALGKKNLKINEISSHFTGIALELSPNLNFQPRNEKKRIQIRQLIGRVLGLKTALLKLFVLITALEIIGLLIPQVTQWIVDSALVSNDSNLLLIAVLGGLLLISIKSAFELAKGWIGLKINQQITIQWSANLFNHLLKLPWLFFSKRHLGDISARFNSLDNIQKTLTNGAITGVLDALVTIITLSMMFFYSTKLTLIVISAAILYAILRLLFYYPLRNATEEHIVLSAKENSYFLETIRAIQPLKLFNLLSLRQSTWQNLLTDEQNRYVNTQKMELFFSTINTLIFGIEGMLILYIGGISVIESTLSLGMLLAFIAYKDQFTDRINQLINLAIEIRMLSLHAERISDIALEPPEKQSITEVDISRVIPRIDIIDISFKYADGEPWVIKNLSLTIQAGESIAIVGCSGSGKSTLMRLILGLLTPTEGEIKVGGISTTQLGLTTLRKLIATIMQDDQLLSGSLAENIACFSPNATQSDIEEAATLANIHHVITQMPMGYQSLVGDLGSGLSGGQKQRVLLARAFYKKPMILAMDEATSHLDVENEYFVVEATRNLNITKISIAHRQETIIMADRIIVMENGYIEEDMTIEEYINKNNIEQKNKLNICETNLTTINYRFNLPNQSY